MSQPFPAFCDTSYQLTNRYAAVERTVNFTCTPNETKGAESKYSILLEPTPGTIPFNSLTGFYAPLPVAPPFNQRCRGLVYYRGLIYGVNGTTVFYIQGGFQFIGTVVDDGYAVTFATTGTNQIFIATQVSGNGYVINTDFLSFVDLSTNAQFLGSTCCTAQDGYVIVVTPGYPTLNQIQISGNAGTPIGDCTIWDATRISQQDGQADALIAVISSREYLRLLGTQRSQIFWNSGAPNFPFVSYNSTYIETGIYSGLSLADMGDSLIWVGSDKRGMVSCWQDFAFQPQQISTFAIERFWSNYPLISIRSSTAFAYTWNGHRKYQITFPKAITPPVSGGNYLNATWEYDATASKMLGKPVWTELTYLRYDGVKTGLATRFHAFYVDFNVHLVGSDGSDGNPGAIYQLSDTSYTQCGADKNGFQINTPIIRERICPHLYSTNKRIVYNRIELEVSRGVGNALGSQPLITLAISRDGGNTYGPDYELPVGAIGQWFQRVYLNRVGYARDLVLKVTYSDPSYMALVNAYLDFFVAGS